MPSRKKNQCTWKWYFVSFVFRRQEKKKKSKKTYTNMCSESTCKQYYKTWLIFDEESHGHYWIQNCDTTGRAYCSQTNEFHIKTRAKLILKPVPCKSFQAVSTLIRGPFRAKNVVVINMCWDLFVEDQLYRIYVSPQHVFKPLPMHSSSKLFVKHNKICKSLHSNSGTTNFLFK